MASRDPLRATAAAELPRHQSCQKDHEALRNRREEAKGRRGDVAEEHCDATEERSYRWVGDVSPRKILRVVDRGQLVAMKAIAFVRQPVEENLRRCEEENQRNGRSDCRLPAFRLFSHRTR